MPETLVVESGNTYLTTLAGCIHWQQQNGITEITNFDVENHVETLKKLGIEYGILKSMSMSNTICVLFANGKIVL